MDFIYQSVSSKALKHYALLKKLSKIFQDLMLRVRGDVDVSLEIMKSLQEKGYIDSSVSLKEFRNELVKQKLIDRNDRPLSKQQVGKQSSNPSYKLSSHGRFRIRESAFNEIFSKLKVGKSGNHSLSKDGGSTNDGFEIDIDKRKFEFGDDPQRIDYQSSLINSVKRSGALNLNLAEDDLEVYEREKNTDVATVLMIDISHSMILYGEDRITPAKQLALALVHLIKTRFSKDELRVVLFGDDAVEVTIDRLTEIDVGPFHTNTQMGLRKSRQILLTMKQPNKQIIMITDGKPSMIKLTDGQYYKNSFGLDPDIVSRTLDEAILCRKKDIKLITVMIADDPILKNFVKQMAKVSKGKAFYSSVDQVGKFVIEDFLKNKKFFF